MRNGSLVSPPLVVLSLFAYELDYTSFNEANTAKKDEISLYETKLQ